MNELLKEKINRILEEYTPRQLMTQEIKRNIDMLKSAFKIVKIIQIQPKDDHNSISGKLTDFAYETVDRSIHKGYQNTMSK